MLVRRETLFRVLSELIARLAIIREDEFADAAPADDTANLEALRVRLCDGFRGCTAGVDASAAEASSFNDGNFDPRTLHASCEWWYSVPGSVDIGVRRFHSLPAAR